MAAINLSFPFRIHSYPHRRLGRSNHRAASQKEYLGVFRKSDRPLPENTHTRRPCIYNCSFS